MGFLDKLRSALGTGQPRATDSPRQLYTVSVRCRRCGEILTAQVNLKNDLSIDYEQNIHHVRKVVMGSGENRCFQRMEVLLTFDQNQQLVDRQVTGGTFVDEPTQQTS